jgi:hypothetical protein
MTLLKRFVYSLVGGFIFFLFGLLEIIVFGYVLAELHGLRYVFRDAVIQGIRTGLYLGSVITVLLFVGGPRRRPSF